MKRIILFLGTIALVSVITFHLQAEYKKEHKQPPKLYKVEQSIEWWSRTINALEAAKTQLKQSDLPSKNVAYLTDSLMIPIQMEITKQVQDQLNAETKAAQQKKDSTSKSKNK
jgi:hypothetical protein